MVRILVDNEEKMVIEISKQSETPEKPERLTKWNGSKWVLPQGRTSTGESYWRIIAERLAMYENGEL